MAAGTAGVVAAADPPLLTSGEGGPSAARAQYAVPSFEPRGCEQRIAAHDRAAQRLARRHEAARSALRKAQAARLATARRRGASARRLRTLRRAGERRFARFVKDQNAALVALLRVNRRDEVGRGCRRPSG
jgi:hypothetical protein